MAAAEILREGHVKFPENNSIIHNLAFVLLISGEIKEGRQLLERYDTVLGEYAKEFPHYEPIFVATWGLVYLLEGHVDLGVRTYKQAAQLAFRFGDRRLAGAVQQKMHAELAKKDIRNSEYRQAMREISAGLSVKQGRPPFRRELEILRDSLKERLNA